LKDIKAHVINATLNANTTPVDAYNHLSSESKHKNGVF